MRPTLAHVLLLAALFILVAIQPPPGPARVALLGDILLGRGVATAHAGQDWSQALAVLAPELQAADISLANLESPLSSAAARPEISTPSSQQSYNLCARPDGLLALQYVRITAVALANNHSRDCGEDGLEQTILNLQPAGLAPITSQQPLYRSISGQRLAFLSFEDVSSPLDLEAAQHAIHLARQQAQWVIVAIHWGSEYSPVPNERQQEMAQAFADAGAVLIWGHHPHVLQRIQWLQGKGLPYRTLVAYSLGNALFDQVVPGDTRRSAMLLVSLGQTGVQSFRAVPFELDPFQGRVVPAGQETRDKVRQRLELYQFP